MALVLSKLWIIGWWETRNVNWVRHNIFLFTIKSATGFCFFPIFPISRQLFFGCYLIWTSMCTLFMLWAFGLSWPFFLFMFMIIDCSWSMGVIGIAPFKTICLIRRKRILKYLGVQVKIHEIFLLYFTLINR